MSADTRPTVSDVQAAVYRALEELGLHAVQCATGAGAAARAVEDPEREVRMVVDFQRREAAAKRGQR